jgi:hypothetical protein
LYSSNTLPRICLWHFWKATSQLGKIKASGGGNVLKTQGETSLTELAHKCAQAMARFRLRLSHDSHSCYELFRLALAEGNQQAWQAIYSQYHRLVQSWLGSPPGDPEELVNQVFTRFWRYVTPEKFANFPTLDHLLKYLKLCSSGVAIDADRAEVRQQVYRENTRTWENNANYNETDRSIDERVVQKINAEELFALASQCLKSSDERIVFFASFEANMKPRMIAEKWSQTFESAQEVSRVKERLLRRLRRDETLLEFLKNDLQNSEKKA